MRSQTNGGQTKCITGGVVAAAITPRRSREHSIDLAATLELIDFLGEAGVDGIALLGTAGECLHFALEDRARMLEFAIKRSRVPILVNISHPTLDGAIFLAQEAAASRVAGVLLTPPADYPYDPDSLHDFTLRVVDEICGQVPLFLSGMPDSQSGTIEQYGGTLTLIEDDHQYCVARERGLAGGVSVAACAIPELMAALECAIRKADRIRIAALNQRLQEFLLNAENWPSPLLLKEALRQRKINVGALAVPLGAAGARKLADFGTWFKAWVGPVLKECR